MATATLSGQLPYPERYEKAAEYVKLHMDGLSESSQLALYALGQQVTQGPTTATKAPGWGWNVVENAKWAAWKQLGNMSAIEAMRLYVRTLDEERPQWASDMQLQEPQEPFLNGNTIVSPKGSIIVSPKFNGNRAAIIAAAAAAAPVDDDALQANTIGTVPGVAKAAASPTDDATGWSQVTTLQMAQGGKQPCPRYEHGIALFGGHVYLVGGNYAGRYLSDFWRFDLAKSSWEQISPNPAASSSTSAAADTAPNGDALSAAADGGEQEQQSLLASLGPVAGHSVNVWGGKLILLGGHVKARTAAAAGPLAVRSLDPATGQLETITTQGEVPCARGGHSATIIGNQLWVFGGEDALRRPLDDLHCLDLGSMTWTQPVVKDENAAKQRRKKGSPPYIWPSPRSAHSAVAVHERYVVILGGGSAAACNADVHILDTQAEGGPAWLHTQLMGVVKPTPRAGHSAVLHGNVMYVIGGGNNVKGCTDMLAIDVSNLLVDGSPAQPVQLTQHVLATSPTKDPLSSEGISLLLLPQPAGKAPILFAFGGYNGKYHNTISVRQAPGLPSPHLLTESTDKQPATQTTVDSGAVIASESTVTNPASSKPVSEETVSNGGTASAKSGQLPVVIASQSLSETDQLRSEVIRLKAALTASNLEAEAAVKAAASASAENAHELALLRKQLATSQASLETASKGLEEARAALARETAKVLKLEAENAEVAHKLSAANERVKELEAQQRQAQDEAEANKKKSSWW